MLNGYKTYLAAIAALLTAVGAFIVEYLTSGVIDATAVISAFIALTLLFLRKSLKTKGE